VDAREMMKLKRKKAF
jgi:hypothetical protein